MTEIGDEEFEKLWDDFLQRWPLESLGAMPLEEYTASGNSDSFTYWLERRTAKLGPIWGMGSRKFGVYSHGGKAEKVSTRRYGYTNEYGWLNKYGNSPSNAYMAVKQQVVKTAQAARSGDIEVINDIDLDHALRWKIAFLYQDRTHASVVGICYRHHLIELLEKSEISSSEIHRKLMASRGTCSLFAYESELWERIAAMKDSPLIAKESWFQRLRWEWSRLFL